MQNLVVQPDTITKCTLVSKLELFRETDLQLFTPRVLINLLLILTFLMNLCSVTHRV